MIFNSSFHEQVENSQDWTCGSQNSLTMNDCELEIEEPPRKPQQFLRSAQKMIPESPVDTNFSVNSITPRRKCCKNLFTEDEENDILDSTNHSTLSAAASPKLFTNLKSQSIFFDNSNEAEIQSRSSIPSLKTSNTNRPIMFASFGKKNSPLPLTSNLNSETTSNFGGFNRGVPASYNNISASNSILQRFRNEHLLGLSNSLSVSTDSQSSNNKCESACLRDMKNNVLNRARTPSSLLPTIENKKNPHLPTISAKTLMDLYINPHCNKNVLIVDCRYDYEYKGGHIKDAINITNPSVLEQVFFLDPRLMYKAAYIRDLKRGLASVLLQQNEMAENFFQIYKNEPLLSEPPIIIFHCEFSMERGPRMYNYLRKLDREYNKKHYPYLAYPEIYLLGDGYSNFIKGFDHMCSSPIGYIQMLDPRYEDDYAFADREDRRFWKKVNKIAMSSRDLTMSSY